MTRIIILNEEEEEELKKIRDKDPKPYFREKAAAILKIASGMSANSVAKFGLLKKRKPDTIYDWLNDWETNGISSFAVQKGRGRHLKQTLSEGDKEALQEILHQSPETFGIKKSRWTIKDIQKAFPRFQAYTENAVWKILKRMKIVYKRGKKLHS